MKDQIKKHLVLVGILVVLYFLPEGSGSVLRYLYMVCGLIVIGIMLFIAIKETRK